MFRVYGKLVDLLVKDKSMQVVHTIVSLCVTPPGALCN